MSSVTLNAREVQTTLADLGITIQCKAAPATAAPAQAVKIDATEGIVTAIVSVTGVEDDVADIILPGAYSETLTKRTPKVCWHHQWEDPIGRTLHIEEWAPGDKRLPTHTKDGKPWPKDAGALVATMQFNMKSKRGVEAFEAVRFYTESNECEWSIGYKVHPGKSVRDKQGRRLIKAVDLYELSFVLFGAAPLSMTLSLKAAVDAWQTKASAVDVETKGTAAAGRADTERAASVEAVEKMLHDLALVEIDWDEVDAAAQIGHIVDMDAIAAQPDWRPEVDRKSSLTGMIAAAKSGEALPDGSYPIQSERDLRAAIRYVEAKDVSEAVLTHVVKRAIVLGRKDLIVGTPMEAKKGWDDLRRALDAHSVNAGIDRHTLARALTKGAYAGVAAHAAGDPARRADVDVIVTTAAHSGKSATHVDELRDRIEMLGPDALGHAAQVVEDEIRRNGSPKDRVDDAVRHLVAALVPDHSVASGAKSALPQPAHVFIVRPVGNVGQDSLGGATKGGESATAGRPAVGSLAKAATVDGSGATILGTGTHAFDATAVLRQLLIKAQGGADRNRGGAEKLRRWYTHGEGAAKIRWGTPGDWARCVRIAGKHMRPDQAKGYCQLRHMEATGEPAGPGAHGGKKKKGKSSEPVLSKSAETAIGTGAMIALRMPAPVASQIAHKDGNPPDELHITLAFLGDAADYTDEVKSAVLSAVQRIVGAAPALSGTIGGIAQFPAGPDGKVPTWVPVDVPGLEEFREQVVDAVEEAGGTVSRSHGYTPHVTLGYDLPPRSPVPSTEVTLDTVRVVFGTDDTPVTMGAALSGYDPAMEDPAMNQTKRLSDSIRLSDGSFDQPSYEDRVEAVNVAARTAFGDERDDGAAVEIRSWVYVRGTWPDKVILTIEKHGTGERETLQVPYTVSDDGEVEFGEPRKVRLVVEVEDDEDEGSLAEDLIADAARYLATDVVEGKAGRVLSTVNTERLRAAVRNLVTVLAAAGVDVLTPTDEDIAAERETGRNSPAPSAPSAHRIESTSTGLNAKSVVIDKAAHEALMARIGLT